MLTTCEFLALQDYSKTSNSIQICPILESPTTSTLVEPAIEIRLNKPETAEEQHQQHPKILGIKHPDDNGIWFYIRNATHISHLIKTFDNRNIWDQQFVFPCHTIAACYCNQLIVVALSDSTLNFVDANSGCICLPPLYIIGNTKYLQRLDNNKICLITNKNQFRIWEVYPNAIPHNLLKVDFYGDLDNIRQIELTHEIETKDLSPIIITDTRRFRYSISKGAWVPLDYEYLKPFANPIVKFETMYDVISSFGQALVQHNQSAMEEAYQIMLKHDPVDCVLRLVNYYNMGIREITGVRLSEVLQHAFHVIRTENPELIPQIIEHEEYQIYEGQKENPYKEKPQEEEANSTEQVQSEHSSATTSPIIHQEIKKQKRPVPETEINIKPNNGIQSNEIQDAVSAKISTNNMYYDISSDYESYVSKSKTEDPKIQKFIEAFSFSSKEERDLAIKRKLRLSKAKSKAAKPQEKKLKKRFIIPNIPNKKPSSKPNTPNEVENTNKPPNVMPQSPNLQASDYYLFLMRNSILAQQQQMQNGNSINPLMAINQLSPFPQEKTISSADNTKQPIEQSVQTHSLIQPQISKEPPQQNAAESVPIDPKDYIIPQTAIGQSQVVQNGQQKNAEAIVTMPILYNQYQGISNSIPNNIQTPYNPLELILKSQPQQLSAPQTPQTIAQANISKTKQPQTPKNPNDLSLKMEVMTSPVIEQQSLKKSGNPAAQQKLHPRQKSIKPDDRTIHIQPMPLVQIEQPIQNRQNSPMTFIINKTPITGPSNHLSDPMTENQNLQSSPKKRGRPKTSQESPSAAKVPNDLSLHMQSLQTEQIKNVPKPQTPNTGPSNHLSDPINENQTLQSTPKKRGRPKTSQESPSAAKNPNNLSLQTEQIKNLSKPQTSIAGPSNHLSNPMTENQNQQSTPKKRGRPKSSQESSLTPKDPNDLSLHMQPITYLHTEQPISLMPNQTITTFGQQTPITELSNDIPDPKTQNSLYIPKKSVVAKSSQESHYISIDPNALSLHMQPMHAEPPIPNIQPQPNNLTTPQIPTTDLRNDLSKPIPQNSLSQTQQFTPKKSGRPKSSQEPQLNPKNPNDLSLHMQPLKPPQTEQTTENTFSQFPNFKIPEFLSGLSTMQSQPETSNKKGKTKSPTQQMQPPQNSDKLSIEPNSSSQAPKKKRASKKSPALQLENDQQEIKKPFVPSNLQTQPPVIPVLDNSKPSEKTVINEDKSKSPSHQQPVLIMLPIQPAPVQFEPPMPSLPQNQVQVQQSNSLSEEQAATKKTGRRQKSPSSKTKRESSNPDDLSLPINRIEIQTEPKPSTIPAPIPQNLVNESSTHYPIDSSPHLEQEQPSQLSTIPNLPNFDAGNSIDLLQKLQQSSTDNSIEPNQEMGAQSQIIPSQADLYNPEYLLQTVNRAELLTKLPNLLYVPILQNPPSKNTKKAKAKESSSKKTQTKQKGKESKTLKTNTPVNSPQSSDIAKKKRGRPKASPTQQGTSMNSSTNLQPEELSQSQNVQPKKRGRPKNSPSSTDQSSNSSTSINKTQLSKRNSPRSKPKTASQQLDTSSQPSPNPIQPTPDLEQKPKNKRGRPKTSPSPNSQSQIEPAAQNSLSAEVQTTRGPNKKAKSNKGNQSKIDSYFS